MPDVPLNLQESVIVSTDNAANIRKAVEDSGMQHIRCCAHTVNLSVQKFCRCLDTQLNNLRPIVKFFHKHPRHDKQLKVSIASFLNRIPSSI